MPKSVELRVKRPGDFSWSLKGNDGSRASETRRMERSATIAVGFALQCLDKHLGSIGVRVRANGE